MDPDRRQWLRRALSLAGSMGLLSGCGGSSGATDEATEQVASSASAASAGDNPAAPSANTGNNTAVATSTTTTATSTSAEAARATLPPAAPPPPVAQTAPRPSWADAVPLNTWHTLPGTAFLPWARTNIPAGAYRGTNPLAAIVNAFSDAAHAPATSAQYFYGGGHGDGTCNAVCRFDHQSLQWSLVGQPTPPSVYLPDYNRTTATITYPSGQATEGFFLTEAELPNPLDAAYRAPALARVSTHMYAAAAMRGDTVHYFYLTYAEFNTRTGTWVGRGVDLGQQLLKFRVQYGKVPLQQGTVAVYDETTDRFFVTLNPGDGGGGWRTALMVFNPASRQIESVHEVSGALGLIGNSVNICKVGRKLYVFQKSGLYGQPTTMNEGLIADMDQMAATPMGSLRTLSALKFRLVGETAASTFPASSTQETIPSWYDGQAIRRWNYTPAHIGSIQSVQLTPVAGSGTAADPLQLTQSTTAIAGNAPTRPMFVYSRFVFHNGARCALLLPEAASDWLALRLS
jgi:hypothetical protein